MQLATERQSLTAVIAEQRVLQNEQAAQINEQQIVAKLQRHTIDGQAEKLSQHQTIIQEQNTLIVTRNWSSIKIKRNSYGWTICVTKWLH